MELDRGHLNPALSFVLKAAVVQWCALRTDMVFLTLSCWIRSRGPDRYWKVQEVLKHARVRPRLFSGEGAKNLLGFFVSFFVISESEMINPSVREYFAHFPLAV